MYTAILKLTYTFTCRSSFSSITFCKVLPESVRCQMYMHYVGQTNSITQVTKHLYLSLYNTTFDNDLKTSVG